MLVPIIIQLPSYPTFIPKRLVYKEPKYIPIGFKNTADILSITVQKRTYNIQYSQKWIFGVEIIKDVRFTVSFSH